MILLFFFCFYLCLIALKRLKCKQRRKFYLNFGKRHGPNYAKLVTNHTEFCANKIVVKIKSL